MRANLRPLYFFLAPINLPKVQKIYMSVQIRHTQGDNFFVCKCQRSTEDYWPIQSLSRAGGNIPDLHGMQTIPG